MKEFSNFRFLEKLSESGFSSIFRGIRLKDQKPVVLKMQAESHLIQDENRSLKREYDVIRSLEQFHGVIKCYSIESLDDRNILVLEDIEGESLNLTLRQRNLDLEARLKVAIKITSCLSQVHSAGIIHRNLNPSNIVVNVDSGEVRIIDFGIATEPEKRNDLIEASRGFGGAMAFMAPEQTGRMNLSTDHRSDYYSLGATLYNLFTGRLPFESSDPLELVHCHIAIKPVPPSQVDPNVPDAISRIIMKLMEKNPESRYQSAFGIIMDLELCLDQLLSMGYIESFEPGLRDISEKLVIPNRIYGRIRESASIFDAFDRSRAGGKELVMVSGRGGIGKTALVNGLQGIIASRRGYFVSGKFDQLHRNILDNAVLYPFREIINQLLSESEEKLAQWRSRLLEALAPNCQVIIDIIPELESIIGPQPSALKLEPIEAENRFKLEFQNFLGVFCRSEHPVTLFLDDVQWADMFSLKLLEFMLIDPDTKYLLVIVSYRDEEVDMTHSFMSTLEVLQKHDIQISPIQLGPLEIENTTELVADTLRTRRESVSELAGLIHQKTKGNPFFLKEFLKSVYEAKIIEFDYSVGRWKWDSSRISSRDVTKNVVALLEDRIGRLPVFCRNLMKVAACIGNRFDIPSLAWFFNEPVEAVAQQLNHAMSGGLIYPIDNTLRSGEHVAPDQSKGLCLEYKFAHDRIQQTCYSLISDGEKPSFHKKLGLAIINNTPNSQIDGKIFEIVDHLNLGSNAGDPYQDRVYLSELNRKVGMKARESTAHEMALSHFTQGSKLLGDGGWETNYELKLELLVEATVAAFLSAQFDLMNELGNEVIKHGRNLIDIIRVYEVRIQAHIARNSRLEAVKTALPVLRLLGEKFPHNPTRIHVLQEMIRTRLLLFRYNKEVLSQLQRMTDTEKVATMRILRSVVSAAYTVTPELFALMIFRMVRLSVKSGLARESALGFAAYAMVMVAIMDDVDSCLKYGDLALRMSSKEHCREDQARVTFVVYCFIKTRNMSTRDGLKVLMDNYHLGRELGDFEYAAVSAAFYCTHSYGAGRELSGLEKEVSRLSRAIGKMKQYTTKLLVDVYHQEILNMMEPSEDPCLLKGRACDESSMLPTLLELKENSIICAIHVQKLRLCYLFRDYRTAVENYEKAEFHIAGAKGSMLAPILLFYGSLALLGLFDGAKKMERRKILRKVLLNQKKLKKWASNAPMNFMHKFLLVEAERLGRLMRLEKSLNNFDMAIQMARENDYVNEEALANERAAMLLISANNRVRAKFYMQESLACYMKWGAFAKVKDLRGNYSDLLGMDRSLTSAAPKDNMELEKDHDIDLAAVIRASQTISGEIVFERLLEKLMNIVIQIGGADKGLLLMESGGAFVVKAVASSDQYSGMDHEISRKRSSLDFSQAIVNYVSRAKKPVIIDDAANDHRFVNDRYFKIKLPKSVCCIPAIRGGELTGILYMENSQAQGVFTPNRLEMLNVLATQAATSILNAVLYRNLDETAKRYESLIENAQEAIFITEKRKLKFCNPKTSELTGYGLEQLKDLDMIGLVFSDDQNVFVEQQNKSLLSSSDPIISSFRIIKKDQALVWVQNNSVSIQWEGKPATLNFLTDITRVKLAGDLQIRTERLKAIGELASGVAHNFNNLLQIMLGGVELSLIDLESGKISQTKKSLEQIRNSIKMGSETVKRLQSFAGIRSTDLKSEPKIFDISSSLSQAFDVTAPLWKANIERNDVSIAIKIQTNPGCYVLGSESEFFEVFINLIKNAVEAMPKGGEITASTQILDKSVLISVGDTGKGISDQDIEKIFEPFWSNKGTSGTGLGLSVSRRIVTEHGGRLSVRSQLGKGTLFTIEVPLAEAINETGIDFISTVKPGGLTVLVIDDSRPIVTLLHDLLTAYGDKVLGADSGAQGIKLFTENHVDIVICDLGMPETSGWEVGRRIVSVCAQRGVQKTPFLLLTGWGGQSLEQERLKESGVDEIIEKPIDLQRLLELIQKVATKISSQERV